MSDTSDYVLIRFAGNQINKVSKILQCSPLTDDNVYIDNEGDGMAELYYVDAGGMRYFGEFIKQGIPFAGGSTAGREYPSYAFAYIGDDEDTQLIDVPAYDFTPWVPIGSDLKPCEADLDNVGDYYRVLEKVNSYLKSNRATLDEAEEENV